MKLTRKQMLAAISGGGAVLGAALVLALLLGSWRWSLGLLGALTVLLAGVVLMALRHLEARNAADLDRLERKIDNLALRVVTESQATHRELGGLIEELGSTLREPGTR